MPPERSNQRYLPRPYCKHLLIKSNHSLRLTRSIYLSTVERKIILQKGIPTSPHIFANTSKIYPARKQPSYNTYLHDFVAGKHKAMLYTHTDATQSHHAHTEPPISISTPSRSHYENPQGGGNPFTRLDVTLKISSYPYKVRDDNRAAKAMFLKVYTAPSSESAESM